MTYQSPPTAPNYPPQRKLSISSMLSFICGILGCIPFVPGILAILLGVLGLIRTHNPLKSGRWMAVLGLVLGIISVGFWILFGGVIAGAAYAAWKGTEAPRAATHDFIQALAVEDDTTAKADSSGFTDEQLHAMEQQVRPLGGFVDTTFTDYKYDWENGIATCHLAGTAQFKSNTRRVSADLRKEGEKWKVTDIQINPH